MTQPETPTWSGAVQRELDGLQRNVETRLTDFSGRLDKLLTKLEYDADTRSTNLRFESLNEKVEDSEHDIDVLKSELRDSIEAVKRDLVAERERFTTAINKETEARQTQHRTYLETRQEQFRWLMSMVMIPIAIAAVNLWMSGK